MINVAEKLTQAQTETVFDLGFSENAKIQDAITTFLNRIAQDSIATAKNYQGHIKQFFRITRKKELNQLLLNDLKYTLMEVEEYQTNLRDKYKTSTVNAKMSAIKVLFTKLDNYDFDINIKAFNVDSYKVYDSKKWDALTKEEINTLIPMVMRTQHGYEKVLAIKIAYATAFRSASILAIKKSDLSIRGTSYCVSTVGKGMKKDIKKIPKSLYDTLIEFSECTEGNRLLTINKNHLQDMMNFINESMDFGERRIVFHSFKKTSIGEMGIITGGNIKAMQHHGAHSSAKTTLDNYMPDTDFENSVVIDFDNEMDISILDGLSKDELLKLIKMSDKGTQFKIINNLDSI